MRAFIALPITDDIKKDLNEYLQPVQSRYHISWVKPQNLHITLHFLGDLDEDNVPEVVRIIKEVGNQMSAFPIHLQGIGRFPNRGRPRIIFVPMNHGLEQCEQLYELLKRKLRRILYMDDRPFTPHVTIGRIKPKHRIPYIIDGPDLSFTADRIVLYNSVLHPDGAEYTPIAEGFFGREDASEGELST